jgi:hypothetical protein
MLQPTPRELMEASIAAVFLSAAALHWSPELSAYLWLLATALAGFAVMPPKPRLVELRVNDMSVSSERAVVAAISAHTSVLGSAVLGQMRLGSQ